MDSEKKKAYVEAAEKIKEVRVNFAQFIFENTTLTSFYIAI